MTESEERRQRFIDLAGEDAVTPLPSVVWWKRWWDRAAPWIVGLLLVALVAGAWVNVSLQRESNASQNHHHSQTEAQDKALLAQEKRNNDLVKEVKHLVGVVISDHASTLGEFAALQNIESIAAQAAKLLPAGQAELQASISWLECAVSEGAPACGPRPSAS